MCVRYFLRNNLNCKLQFSERVKCGKRTNICPEYFQINQIQRKTSVLLHTRYQFSQISKITWGCILCTTFAGLKSVVAHIFRYIKKHANDIYQTNKHG